MRQETLILLQALRTEIGKKFKINSAYRCPEQNTGVGGARNSQHIKGTAVDIAVNNWSPSDRLTLIHVALQIGFTGIGVYKNFIHLDTRKIRPSFWRGDY